MMRVGFKFGRAGVWTWSLRRQVLCKLFGVDGFGFLNVEGPITCNSCEMSCGLYNYSV